MSPCGRNKLLPLRDERPFRSINSSFTLNFMSMGRNELRPCCLFSLSHERKGKPYGAQEHAACSAEQGEAYTHVFTHYAC